MWNELKDLLRDTGMIQENVLDWTQNEYLLLNAIYDKMIIIELKEKLNDNSR